jgi:hypothetical protein
MQVGPRTGAGYREVLTRRAGTRRVAFGVGNVCSLFPRDGRRSLRSVVLMTLTRGRLFARARILCDVRTVHS